MLKTVLAGLCVAMSTTPLLAAEVIKRISTDGKSRIVSYSDGQQVYRSTQSKHRIQPVTLSPPIRADQSHTGHIRPGHIRPGHIRPGHIRPGHIRPGHIRPGHIRPGHIRPKQPDSSVVTTRNQIKSNNNYRKQQTRTQLRQPVTSEHYYRQPIYTRQPIYIAPPLSSYSQYPRQSLNERQRQAKSQFRKRYQKQHGYYGGSRYGGSRYGNSRYGNSRYGGSHDRTGQYQKRYKGSFNHGFYLKGYAGNKDYRQFRKGYSHTQGHYQSGHHQPGHRQYDKYSRGDAQTLKRMR